MTNPLGFQKCLLIMIDELHRCERIWLMIDLLTFYTLVEKTINTTRYRGLAFLKEST